MNKAFTHILFLAIILAGSFNGVNIAAMDSTTVFSGSSELGNPASDFIEVNPHTDPESDFLREAKRLKIPARNASGLSNVYNGFYLVAGVFGEKGNALRFSGNLTKRNLGAHVLYNPKKQLHYVYLEYHQSGIKAINSCISNLDGKYKETVWILNVTNSKPAKKELKNSSKTKRTELSGLAEFSEIARKYRVSKRIISKLKGVRKGFYLIAGVYGDQSNAARQLKQLKQKHLNPRIIRNEENQMYYIYLDHELDAGTAVEICSSGLNGKYSQKLWILAITGEENEPKAVPPAKEEQVESQQKHKKSFRELADTYNIPVRSDAGFGGLGDGFYLVAGVFGDSNNAKSYLQKVIGKHPDANLVTQPTSNLNYIYLKHYEDGKTAISKYLDQLGGSYKDPIWILHIESPESLSNKLKNPQQIVIEEPGMEYPSYTEKKSSYKTTHITARPVVNDKLLEKADSYFDKMWYSEAAELYEMILNENPENQSFNIIRKAGDAHYFNTNMERAFYWYDILYNKHKSEMKADNLFRYAHSLKGTGKYGRAKRLMKLYDKALKEESSRRTFRPRTNEATLDNLLATELEYEIKNIGVNSEYSDFSPMFYQDNKVVFASAMDSAFFNTRRYKWNDQPYLDLYVAKINEESDEVRNAVKFSRKINTKYHEAAVSFSPDQQTIYFTRNNYGKKLKRDKKGINNLKIYMSHKVGDSWSEAKELPFNSDEYSTGHPALSPDGKKLYFVSDMPGSIGKTDLFVVDILGDGQFSEPRNLGPEINTERREMFPFFSGEKLYFSSDGHTGLGGLDVYEVSVTEEGFSEVINMGQPINSKRDDFSYIVNEETQKGFFASNRRGGKGDDDIYSFKRILPEEPNENAIAGVVTEIVSGEVMPKSLVTLLDENNMKLMEMETGEDGSFVFEELDSNTRYVIRTEKDTYFQDEQEVTTLDNERVEVAVQMKKLEELIVLEDGIRKLKTDMIYFDFDKFNIRSDATEELDKLVEVMNTYPTMVIKIESHTDSRGKRAYNKYLSDKRAKSTRDYLIGKGIDPKRIESAIGYGEERLLNECNGTVRCSSAKHQLNRRSEFIIVSM